MTAEIDSTPPVSTRQDTKGGAGDREESWWRGGAEVNTTP